jgi:hypothetical protein
VFGAPTPSTDVSNGNKNTTAAMAAISWKDAGLDAGWRCWRALEEIPGCSGLTRNPEAGHGASQTLGRPERSVGKTRGMHKLSTKGLLGFDGLCRCCAEEHEREDIWRVGFRMAVLGLG